MKAWFEFDAEWVVGLWGLKPAGAVRLDGHKVRVQVEVEPERLPPQLRVSSIAPASTPVVSGALVHAIVPTNLVIVEPPK